MGTKIEHRREDVNRLCSDGRFGNRMQTPVKKLGDAGGEEFFRGKKTCTTFFAIAYDESSKSL
jgi:hypothetical protein